MAEALRLEPEGQATEKVSQANWSLPLQHFGEWVYR